LTQRIEAGWNELERFQEILIIMSPVQTSQKRFPATMSRRTSRVFVTIFLLLAIVVAVVAVRTVMRINSDPELQEQLQEVHERSSRG